MAHWKVTQRAQHGVEHHRGEIEAYLDRRRNDSLVVFRRRARRNKYNSLSFMRNLSGSLNRGLLFPLYELRGETTRDRETIRRGERERERNREKEKKRRKEKKIERSGEGGMRRSYDLDRAIYQGPGWRNFDGEQMRYRTRKKRVAPEVGTVILSCEMLDRQRGSEGTSNAKCNSNGGYR